jgi:hypothetical protein
MVYRREFLKFSSLELAFAAMKRVQVAIPGRANLAVEPQPLRGQVPAAGAATTVPQPARCWELPST